MKSFSRCFGRTVFLLATGALPLAASAQPAPPNTTIEIPGRAPQAHGAGLPLVTWDELQQQLGGPSLVSLHAEKLSALQLIEALNQQTPVRVSARSASSWKELEGKLFSANYERQPFWNVVRDMAQNMRIGLSNSSSSQAVQFVNWAPEPNALTQTSGPCLFVLSDVEHHRTLQAAGSAPQGANADDATAQESLALKGRFFLDPKVRWQSSDLSIVITEATDENDQSLRMETDPSDSHFIVGNPSELKLELKPPAKRPDGTRSSRLKLLRGSLHGAIALQTQRWEIDDALTAKNAEKTFGRGNDAMRVELEDIKKEGDDYRAVLIVSQSKSSQEGQLRYVKLATGKGVLVGISTYRDLQLLDEQNRPLQQVKIDTRTEGDQETRIVTITATFRPQQGEEESQRTGTPAKFVFDYASDYRELIVPFEFKDVPLP